MCAKPLVSFYEGLFAFAAAFVAAVFLPDLTKASQKHGCHFVQWSVSRLLLWGLKRYKRETPNQNTKAQE